MMRQRETPKSHFLLPDLMQKQGQNGGPSGKWPWKLPLTGEVLVGPLLGITRGSPGSQPPHCMVPRALSGESPEFLL